MALINFLISKASKLSKNIWIYFLVALALFFTINPWYIDDVPVLSLIFGYLNLFFTKLFDLKMFSKFQPYENIALSILKALLYLRVILGVLSYIVVLPILKWMRKQSSKPKKVKLTSNPIFGSGKLLPLHKRIIAHRRLKALEKESDFCFLKKDKDYIRVQRIAKTDKPAQAEELLSFNTNNRCEIRDSFSGNDIKITIYKDETSDVFLTISDYDLKIPLEYNTPTAVPFNIDANRTIILYVITLI